MMTTLRAYANSTPMSSAVPDLTCRVSPVPSAPAPAVTTDPNALKSTLVNDRPMALDIIRVRRMPDAPTRVPAMIRRLLLSVKPDAATARPVNEFSSEMSTGTSAPPIGSTKMMPSTSDSTAVAIISATLSVTIVATARTTIPTPTRPLMIC